MANSPKMKGTAQRALNLVKVLSNISEVIAKRLLDPRVLVEAQQTFARRLH